MSLNLKTFYSALVGAWGALLGWAALDLLLGLEMEEALLDALVNGLLVGGGIGLLVGALEGAMEAKLRPLLKGAALGLVLGLLGGAAGLVLGELSFQLLGENAVGRVLGWTLFGLGVGMSEGVAHRSTRRLLHGSLGGLLGGLLGGVAFTAARQLLERPTTGRAWGYTLLGGLVGLFIGLVPALLKSAWLKVVSSGRDEGRERIVEKGVTTIGSSDVCDLGLYGDPSILPVHAEVRQERGEFILYPKGPVTVNEQPVGQHVLQDEDRIGLGAVRVRFRKR